MSPSTSHICTECKTAYYKNKDDKGEIVNGISNVRIGIPHDGGAIIGQDMVPVDLTLCTKCNRPFCHLHIDIGEGHQCRILNYKMVILVRKDLNMSAGKVGAQVAHAAVDLVWPKINAIMLEHIQLVDKWHDEGGRKVVLEVADLDEMLSYKEKAEKTGLNTALVLDYGLTEVPKNSYTVLGIGPDTNERIDAVTGDLKTLRSGK